MLWDTGRLWQENCSCVPPPDPAGGHSKGARGAGNMVVTGPRGWGGLEAAVLPCPAGWGG